MTETDPRDEALLDELAERIVRWRVTVPAMMALETVRPINLVSSSMLHVLSPLWRMILPASRIEDAARLLEQRDAIPRLIERIDSAEDEHLRRAREAKAAPRDVHPEPPAPRSPE